ncbi:hypothetical protein [Flavobacterium terrisoli]|uniref:hypothetical protein n=1 Tax=Flavobacterium terrisoli TaxID=3242195 RepID=UPI0025433389|nr:hypothetical protein [Flavobacterium buctense]
MASTSETGHAKNVANFETLITFCTGYGATYNPTNNELKISSLQSTFDEAKLKLKAVKDSKGPFDMATGERQLLFKPLKPLATRIINVMIAQNAAAPNVKDARTIIRKLTGKRAGETTITTPEENQISVSQQSYDRLVDSFEELIVVTQNEPNYNPNENELKVATLQDLLTQLSASNTAVRNAYVPYSNAIISRNDHFYEGDTALVNKAFDVKNYIKALFGATSPQYRQISSLVFKRPKE